MGTTEQSTSTDQHSGWFFDTTNLSEKLSEWGTAAGKLIDDADRKIEELENRAGTYLKNVVQVSGPEDSQHETQPKQQTAPEKEADVPVTRLEAQLHTIHTSPDLFEGAEEGDVAEREPEIAKLLQESPELASLAKELEPKLGRGAFWSKYFELREKAIADDRARKELLSKQKAAVEVNNDSGSEWE